MHGVQELLGVQPKWFDAGAKDYGFPPLALLSLEFLLLGFLELKRYQGFKKTGKVHYQVSISGQPSESFNGLYIKMAERHILCRGQNVNIHNCILVRGFRILLLFGCLPARSDVETVLLIACDGWDFGCGAVWTAGLVPL